MVPLEVEQEPRSIACFFFFILTTPKHILHILRCDELVTNKFYTHPTGNEMWWGLRVQFSSLFSSLHASLPVLFSACFTWLDEWNTRLMPPRFEPLTSRDYTGALSHRATVPCQTIIFLLFLLSVFHFFWGLINLFTFCRFHSFFSSFSSILILSLSLFFYSLHLSFSFLLSHLLQACAEFPITHDIFIMWFVNIKWLIFSSVQ